MCCFLLCLIFMAELSRVLGGGGGAGLKLQLCPDLRHPPAVTSGDTLHLSPAPASTFNSSSSRGIFNPDKMLDVFVRVFEKYKARCGVLELRRAAVQCRGSQQMWLAQVRSTTGLWAGPITGRLSTSRPMGGRGGDVRHINGSVRAVTQQPDHNIAQLSRTQARAQVSPHWPPPVTPLLSSGDNRDFCF